MDLKLTGHTALVTGAANGIGLATARALAEEGCRVALWDLSPGVRAAAEELAGQTSARVTAHEVDVSRPEQVAAAFAETLQQHSDVMHVVHAAAVSSGKFGFPFTQVPATQWNRTLQINIMGMVHVAQVTAPHFMQNRAGSYVFLASVAGQIGSQTDPPYSASKAANINFAQCMAKDLAAYGVRVNTVCPGMVATALNRSVWQAWHDQAPAEERLSYELWAERKIRQLVPLGQWQTPTDIANMIVFLSSERCAQVTGQTINVDGGFVMHW